MSLNQEPIESDKSLEAIENIISELKNPSPKTGHLILTYKADIDNASIITINLNPLVIERLLCFAISDNFNKITAQTQAEKNAAEEQEATFSGNSNVDKVIEGEIVNN